MGATNAHLHKINNKMNTSIINFDYKGSEISFINGDNVMINATQMAKPFGKEPKHWLLNQSTRDFIQALSEVRNLTSADLVKVTKGGVEQGTWMHEDVALEFARWLSPAFAIWCNDRIKELMKTGVATVSNDDEAIAYAMQVLQKRLEQARQEKAMLEQQNLYLTNEIKEQAPKVQYVDTVLQSVNTYSANLIAKEMGMSAETLNRRLKEKGVIYKQGGVWVLTAKYQGKGYTKTRTHAYTRSDGSQGTSMLTVWTETGRAFLHSIFQQ